MQEIQQQINSQELSTQLEKYSQKWTIANLTKISALKTVTLTKEQLLAWAVQIENDFKSGVIVDIDNGFNKLLSERAYGGLDYAIFLEGAKKDISKEASEQLIICLKDLNKTNERTQSIIKEFGGVRYLSELKVSDMAIFRKEFLKAYGQC